MEDKDPNHRNIQDDVNASTRERDMTTFDKSGGCYYEDDYTLCSHKIDEQE